MSKSIKDILVWASQAKSNNVWAQLVRYLLSGGVAFIVDKLVFLLTRYYFELNKFVSTSLGFLIGLIITYTLSVVWIFSEHRLKSRPAELGVFALIGLIGIVLMNVFMWLFSDLLHIQSDFIANILSTICVTLWNFIAKKYILFTKSSH